MSDKLVHGKDIMVYLGRLEDDLWEYYPVVCAKSSTITRQTEVIETTHYASTAKEFTEGMYEWGLTLEGVVAVEPLTTGDFLPLSLLLPPGLQKLKLIVAGMNGNFKEITGDVIIPGFSATGDVSDYSSFTIEMKGSGPLTIL